MKKTNKKSWIAMRYYVQKIWKYKLYTLGAVFAIPLAIIMNRYAPPLIIANVIQRLSNGAYDKNDIWGSFGGQLTTYMLLLISGILLWRIVDFFMWKLEQNVTQDIAEEVFKHLMGRSAGFHANRFGGSLVSQTNKLIRGYVRVADTTIFGTYPLIIGLVTVVVVLSPKAPLYTIGLMLFALLYLVVSFLLAKPIHKHLTKYSASESKQTGLLADAISNVMVVKSFARQRFENQRFHEATTNTKRYLRKFARIHQIQMMSLGVLIRLISGFALVAAVVSVLKFNIGIATVFLILSYTLSVVDDLFQFSNSGLRNYNRALGDAKEMAETLSEQQEVKDPKKPKKLAISRGKIEFKNVKFLHDGAEKPIFDGLNISIKPGEKIGLVGHSGSGKTTLTRVLQRFSDIDSGQILIDGQNIAGITQDDLHSVIAYVAQEPLLFHRSVKENIAYGDLNADTRTIETVAKMASAHDFIKDLPNGYKTLVGERGVKLSGGQRQRIAIARAMLKNAPILVLDEATSALDSESEVLIQAALWKLMEGRTAIVVAHRLSTIQKMDRIIVMDGGNIVEQGTHKELISSNGTYAKLWNHQSGGFLE